TKGKTTTTALTAAVLTAGGTPVIVAGNIGAPAIDRLDDVTERHWVVLELSSFQIESVAEPRVHVAVVTNVTPDHLERHGTFEHYAEIKGRLVAGTGADDFAVLNRIDLVVRGFASRTQAKIVWFDEFSPVPSLSIPGRHNVLNAMAAA